MLISLLTPALDKAMTSASSAVCMTNLRTWSVAMRQYALDYKGKAPDGVTNVRSYWWSRLATYVGGTNPSANGVTWMKANVCPEASVALDTGIRAPFYGLAGGNYWGSAHKVWQWGTASINGTAGSYGMNSWLLPELDQSPSHTRANFWGRYTNVPGDAAVLGDCNWVNAWPNAALELPPKDTENGSASTDPAALADPNGLNAGGHMGRYVLNRHNLSGMAVNLSFVDTSAQNVRLGALWNLRWHKNSDVERTDAYKNEYQ